MLANRTPPSCIQANIYAMARTCFPQQDIVLDLPSLRHIKYLRTTLSLITKTLAAFSVGNSKKVLQMHNDATKRRLREVTNSVLSILDEDDNLKTLCLSGSIIPEDGSAENRVVPFSPTSTRQPTCSRYGRRRPKLCTLIDQIYSRSCPSRQHYLPLD